MDDARPLPLPDPETAFFWKGCLERRLLILRCRACGTFVHLPRPACRSCGGRDLAPAPVSGRGTVWSYTITHRAVPGFGPPFAVALVELEEQRGLRLVTNLTDVPPEAVEIGAPVEVDFREVAPGVVLPLFRGRA